MKMITYAGSESLLLFSLFFLYVYVTVCMCVPWLTPCVAGFLLCVFLESNSGPQSWQQVPLPTEASHGPCFAFEMGCSSGLPWTLCEAGNGSELLVLLSLPPKRLDVGSGMQNGGVESIE